MSNRSLINLILLVFVAILVTVLLLEPGIEPPPQPAKLTALEPRQIQRVRIERPDQPGVTLTREDGQWRLREPLDLPANEFRVDSILDLLAAESEAEVPVPDTGLQPFGLDPPRVTLYLDETRLELGDTESLHGWRYVRVGEALHLTADRYYHHLVGGPAALVHLHPLGPRAQPVEILLPDGTLRLAEGGWTLEPPAEGIGADRIQALVEAWRDTQALSVRPYEPPAETEAPREVSIRLSGQQTPLRFQVRDAEHNLILARPDVGVQYQLPPGAEDRLFRLEAPAPEAFGEDPLPAPEADLGTPPTAPAESGGPPPPADGPDPLPAEPWPPETEAVDAELPASVVR